MIHYNLHCTTGHVFDGWFRSSTAFDDQVARKLVCCPQCGDPDVTRALMTPALGRRQNKGGRTEATPVTPEAAKALAVEVAASLSEAQSSGAAVPDAVPAEREATLSMTGSMTGGMPDQLRAALQRLRTEVERNCENVGADFAEEARRIHYGKSDNRGIYGETTPDEAEALAEEGITVACLPWVGRADS